MKQSPQVDATRTPAIDSAGSDSDGPGSAEHDR
jgi:hypothetical protein